MGHGIFIPGLITSRPSQPIRTSVLICSPMTTRTVPRSQLDEVCERAARFHRMQVADRETPLELEYSVVGRPDYRPITVGPDGWARVGVVHDAVEFWDLAVYWNPETDRIKLQKPAPREYDDPVPSISGDPLYKTNPVSSKALTRPFTARPGYIYTYQGQDYSANEAERTTAELGSIDGWTWRREPG